MRKKAMMLFALTVTLMSCDKQEVSPQNQSPEITQEKPKEGVPTNLMIIDPNVSNLEVVKSINN